MPAQRKSRFEGINQTLNSRIHDDDGNKKGSVKEPCKQKLTSTVFINFALILYGKRVDRSRPKLTLFTNLNKFETWFLNPLTFDYEKFNSKWLIDLVDLGVLKEFSQIKVIAAAIEKELCKDFNPILAEIKYKYFGSVSV